MAEYLDIEDRIEDLEPQYSVCIPSITKWRQKENEKMAKIIIT